MRILHECDRAALLIGDSSGLDLPEHSVDALVTDPPAGIGFMGLDWDAGRLSMLDWSSWLAETLAPSFRALKPGAHGLVWALPRTSHWTALALEDAGFEVRDVHHHLFGTGFPKSLTSASAEIPPGTGTALKPAAEHWILVRKPLGRGATVERCHAEHGTGILNVDACRVGEPAKAVYGGAKGDAGGTVYGKSEKYLFEGNAAGRWPAHLSLEHAEGCRVVGSFVEARDVFTNAGDKHRRGDESTNMAMGRQVVAGTEETIRDAYECVLGCPVRQLDEQSGVVGSHGGDIADGKSGIGFKGQSRKKGRAVAKSRDGGASRFFYVAKPPRFEKDAGLEHLEPLSGAAALGREEGSAGLDNPHAGAGRRGGARNTHPTVKPVALMRWLVRLVTPPGGLVLDPFAGSGTTGVAALLEGCRFIGAERADDPRYEAILRGRIERALADSAPGVGTSVP